MNSACSVEHYSPSDKKDLVNLLSTSKLPTEDLNDSKLENFMVARAGDGFLVGVGGVEIYGKNGLLRSLAVHASHRGHGIGRLLVRAIESLARRNGVRTLYLLTETAAEYFPKVGYGVIQRDKVPEAITKTDEFRGICPVSAVCLSKSL